MDELLPTEGGEAASCRSQNVKHKQSMLVLKVGFAAGALWGISENIMGSLV